MLCKLYIPRSPKYQDCEGFIGLVHLYQGTVVYGSESQLLLMKTMAESQEPDLGFEILVVEVGEYFPVGRFIVASPEYGDDKYLFLRDSNLTVHQLDWLSQIWD